MKKEKKNSKDQNSHLTSKQSLQPIHRQANGDPRLSSTSEGEREEVSGM